MPIPNDLEIADRAAREHREIKRDLRQVLLSGVVITVPIVVTLLVLSWVLNVVSNALTPVVGVLVTYAPVDGMAPLALDVLAAAFVLGVVFSVGLLAQHGPKTGLGKRVDLLVKDIPGIGSIYTSVEQVSETILGSDAQSFQEVLLVEFPTTGGYALAFHTADTSAVIEDAVDSDDMVTVFVPMAPNPVMGGHLLNVPRDEVYDVDLSVQAAMQAIMTTGVTVADPEEADGAGQQRPADA